MAKETLPTNYTDDIMASSMDGKRRYNLIQNSDGTVSLEDVTNYTQVGSNFGAAQMNQTNTAVNNSADKNKIIDSLADVSANTQGGMMAGALSVRELNNKLADSGWVACGMGNGLSAAEGQAPSVRKIGNTVYLRGSVTNSTSWSSHDSFLTIPSGYRPSVSARFIQWGYGTYRYTLSVEANGTCVADHVTNNQNGDFKIPSGSTLRINCSWLVN